MLIFVSFSFLKQWLRRRNKIILNNFYKIFFLNIGCKPSKLIPYDGYGESNDEDAKRRAHRPHHPPQARRRGHVTVANLDKESDNVTVANLDRESGSVAVVNLDKESGNITVANLDRESGNVAIANLDKESGSCRRSQPRQRVGVTSP